MEKKIAPSEQKAQALRALLQGQAEGQSGEELLSLVRAALDRADFARSLRTGTSGGVRAGALRSARREGRLSQWV